MKASLTLLFLFAMAALAIPTHTVEPNLLQVIFPSYLVPLKEISPDVPQGTKYDADVSFADPHAGNETRLIAGFDVPKNAATTCLLKFRLPWASSNSWSLHGHGKLNFYGLDRIVNPELHSWNHRPNRLPSYPLGQIQVIAGGEGIVTGSIPCHLGARMDFELAAAVPTTLHWYELDSPKTGITIEMWA